MCQRTALVSVPVDSDPLGGDSPASMAATAEQEPWQLKMFGVSLKKQKKLRLLLEQIGDVRGKDCLLITNGDNNGALNYRFREHGGTWHWVELEADHKEEIERLLGEQVLAGTPTALPCADEAFDVVVSIDVHEHLEDCRTFNTELRRITKRGGSIVVTTPNGDRHKAVTLLKLAVGMTPEKYGHRVIGYNVAEHEAMLQAVGLTPVGSGSYSRFFTELIELAINFAYVMVLKRKERNKGAIAPTSSSDLQSVEKQYRLYRRVYPLLRAISSLDVVLSPFTGYAVSVVAKKAS